MDYICLAAGKGTRFGNLGSYLQKCMYPIGIRPFVEYSAANLLKSKHINLEKDRLIFVVGHHAEQIHNYFGNNYKGLSVLYVEQIEQLGTAHALHVVYEALEPTGALIAWLADAYVKTEQFEALYEHPQPNVQTLGEGHEDEKPDLQIDIADGLVTKAFDGDSGLYDVGLWKLSPEVLDLMLSKFQKEYRILLNLQYALEQGHTIGYVVTEKWIHLGGTLPTIEENVQEVVAQVLALEKERN